MRYGVPAFPYVRPAAPVPDFGVTAAELAWQDDALCRFTDGDAFFPEKGQPVKPAKRVCAACPVRAECLEYALEHDEKFGVWGGMSEPERRRLKRGQSGVAA